MDKAPDNIWIPACFKPTKEGPQSPTDIKYIRADLCDLEAIRTVYEKWGMEMMDTNDYFYNPETEAMWRDMLEAIKKAVGK